MYKLNTSGLKAFDLPPRQAKKRFGNQSEKTLKYSKSSGAMLPNAGGALSPIRTKQDGPLSPLRSNTAGNDISAETFGSVGTFLPSPTSMSRQQSMTRVGSAASLGSYQGDMSPKAFDQESADDDILRGLVTGEDVISFFAKMGNSSSVKFVHLNRARTGHVFRPYDLVVTDSTNLDLENFTMTADGLVRVSPKMPSEFVPLSEWMRESTLLTWCLVLISTSIISSRSPSSRGGQM